MNGNDLLPRPPIPLCASLPLCLFAAICFLLIAPLSLYAQDTTVTSTTASTLTSTVTADDVNRIASNLWCPLCSGIRLDACELQACEQMREEIAIKLEAGETLASIQQDFVTKYGPQVMGEPPKEGFSLLAWVLPFVALVAGAFFLILRSRQLVAKPALSTAQTTAPSSAGERTADPLERRLDEELAKIE